MSSELKKELLITLEESYDLQEEFFEEGLARLTQLHDLIQAIGESQQKTRQKMHEIRAKIKELRTDGA